MLQGNSDDHWVSRGNTENSETEADWEGDLGKTCDLVKEFWYEVSRELPLKKFVKKRVPTYMLETSYIHAIQETVPDKASIAGIQDGPIYLKSHDVTNYSVKYFLFFKVFVHSISMVTSDKN